MSTPLKIAVVGADGMGRRTARALANDPAWELVAISDLKPEVRAAVAKISPTSASQTIRPEYSPIPLSMLLRSLRWPIFAHYW